MKHLLDIHTHSLASRHAYSTVEENFRWAAEQGLQMVALTDHAPAMRDTTCHAYFANLHILPKTLHGVRLLAGIELNILDFDGRVDMDAAVLSGLDIAIASLHPNCLAPGSKRENTRALICAMENPYVDVIGHPGAPQYAVDYAEVFRKAQETGTLLEINNASLVPGGFRDGSRAQLREILRMSMEAGQPVVLGSDAHFYRSIGDFTHAEALLQELNFPEELVLNTCPEKFLASLKRGNIRKSSLL